MGSYELSIVEMNDENDCPGQLDYYPLNENVRPAAHEMKVLDMNHYVRCHDRQIQRLQKDQTKRIDEYRALRLQLAADTNGLQKQINGIRSQLQKMNEKAAQVEEIRTRLINCEEHNLEMQIHNDSEFEALRTVMEQFCGRIDRMEELQRAEREQLRHFQQQQQHQQTMRASIIHSAPPGTSQEPRQHRASSDRVECPNCAKLLSKGYIRAHLRMNRCKCTAPYNDGSYPQRAQ